MTKESNYQENIKIVNIYASNIGASRYIKQVLTYLKGEIDSNIITLADLNNPFSTMVRSVTKKINKETLNLKYTLDKIGIRHIYRTFHSTVAEYLFSRSTHGTFSRIGSCIRSQSKT